MTLQYFRRFFTFKNLSFSKLFSIHFCPHFWTLLWTVIFAHLGRPRCRSSRLRSVLVPFWGPRIFQKGSLGDPVPPRNLKKGRSPELLLSPRGRPGSELCSKRTPKAIRIDLGPFLEPSGSDFGPLEDLFQTDFEPYRGIQGHSGAFRGIQEHRMDIQKAFKAVPEA